MQAYLNGAIDATSTPKVVRAGTVRRIAGFARPHRAGGRYADFHAMQFAQADRAARGRCST
jgi:hypothetical protein